MVAREQNVSGRKIILDRIKLACRDVPNGEESEDVVMAGPEIVPASIDPVQLFVERLNEYRGAVRRAEAEELGAAITEVCGALEVGRLVVPPEIDQRWLPREVEVVPDVGFSGTELDGFDGVLTGCCFAIAETGTIVLDAGHDSGRRAITLVPDVHICVVRADQIVGSVPEAIERLRAVALTTHAPLTFISGPSATSDIEFRRVEGVHGPRRLEVLLVD
jgi:L-lactate dehydrogenase complex protein LldG